MTTTYAPRKCGACKQMRSVDDFLSTGARARCALCRDRDNENVRMPRPDGWSLSRERNLWNNYRIRPHQYEALREQQDYRCAICGTHEDDLPVLRTGRPPKNGEKATQPFKLLVDHCHNSGRVRGLLCHTCNASIGHAKDSVEILRAAIRYLETR